MGAGGRCSELRCGENEVWSRGGQASGTCCIAGSVRATPVPYPVSCSQVLEVVSGRRGVSDREQLADTIYQNTARMFFGGQ